MATLSEQLRTRILGGGRKRLAKAPRGAISRVAEHLGVPYKTVRHWVVNGGNPSKYLAGNVALLLRMEDFDFAPKKTGPSGESRTA